MQHYTKQPNPDRTFLGYLGHKVPAAYNSGTIKDIEAKLGGLAESNKLINLM